MKNWNIIIAVILFVSTFLTGCKNKEIAPNIILVLTDDQGYGDISAHGSPDVLTPNMDKLKSQGINRDKGLGETKTGLRLIIK